MKERPSEVSDKLFLLKDAEAFALHAKQLVGGSRRELVILSELLDPLIYDQALSELVSQLARGDRKARVRILLKNIQPVIERGHPLLALARRLSSKLEIRRLLIEAENEAQAYLIGDRDHLLYLHSDREYKGFSNYAAGPEVARLLESFNHLWERHSEASPALRALFI
ncbi:hypothetical protein F6455_04030 [Proteobacteria bacterium 005FR1]|nr:hypothetical protein [Proteobacteria bacterium 005FR1]